MVAGAGVQLYEGTPVRSISAGVARTGAGDVRAPFVLRCTEGFTAGLPGQHRTLLPMNSSMIVTGPLSESAWKSIGWDGCETLGDEAHAYIYAQRTADGRIALGGRGIPYRFGSGLDQDGAIRRLDNGPAGPDPAPHVPGGRRGGHGPRLVRGARGAQGLVRHGHDGPAHRPGLGGRLLGPRGGRGQPGRAHARRPGRGVPSPLTTLPWVGHRSPRWEPEPARWAGVHGLYALYRTADRLEAAGRSGRTSLLARAGDMISGIPH